MKKNGFTLIEIIGVIVILGIIAIIAIPTFTRNLNEFRDDYYKSQESTFLASGKEFFSDNSKYLPSEYFESSKVTLNTLEGQNYIDKVKDYNGNDCNKDSYVIVIKKGANDYTYETCLKCEKDDYDNTNKAECSSIWDKTNNVVTELGKPPVIYIYKGTTRDKLEEALKVSLDIVKYDDDMNEVGRVNGDGMDGIETVLPVNVDIIDTDKEGEYRTIYKYKNKIEEGKVIVYEHKAPVVKLEKENQVREGTVTSAVTTEKGSYNATGEWAQKLNIDFSVTTESESVLGLSKTSITKYQIKRGERWLDFCTVNASNKCSISLTEEMNEDVYFRAVDNLGNLSQVAGPYKLRIDNTPPSCTLNLNGTLGNNNWYTSDVTITFKTASDIVGSNANNVSGVRTKGITLGNITNVESAVQNQDTASVKWYGFIEDNARNSNICSIDFKRDATVPYAVWSPESEGPHDNNDGIDVVVYCKDDMSGASSENRKTIHIPSPSEGKEVETSCVDNAGNTNGPIKKKYYVRIYSQDPVCGWDDCLTGENTCQGGYPKVWSSCASKSCSYGWSGSAVCINNKTNKGTTQSASGSGFSSSGAAYGACQSYQFCAGSTLAHSSCSVHQSCSCKGGYVNGNYDPCLTGHNTCQGGYKSCWHY